LLGLGLAIWMEFYTYDAANLVLPEISGSFAYRKTKRVGF
jgi:DHA2 family multidrug resistance protein